MTRKEWEKKGVALFGDNTYHWRFVCPNCGNIQSAEDFRKYKEQGATPDSAYSQCIGRYQEGAEGTLRNKKSPCDYTAGGLFNLNPIEVVVDDKTIYVFEFSE